MVCRRAGRRQGRGEVGGVRAAPRPCELRFAAWDRHAGGTPEAAASPQLGARRTVADRNAVQACDRDGSGNRHGERAQSDHNEKNGYEQFPHCEPSSRIPSGSAARDWLTRRTLKATASAQASARRTPDGGAVEARDRVRDGERERNRPESCHDQQCCAEESLHDVIPPRVTGLRQTSAEREVGATKAVGGTHEQVGTPGAALGFRRRRSQDGGSPHDRRKDDHQREKFLAHARFSAGASGYRGVRSSRPQRLPRGRATGPAWLPVYSSCRAPDSLGRCVCSLSRTGVGCRVGLKPQEETQ
jgi:hypothetical protein